MLEMIVYFTFADAQMLGEVARAHLIVLQQVQNVLANGSHLLIPLK